MANVLLVEDDRDQLGIRKVLLESAGHHVETAASVADAEVCTAGCEIIIMDVVDGCEEWLARIPAVTRVIILSGRHAISPRVAERCTCVLRKPCRSQMLLDAIADVCPALHGH